MMIIHGMRAVTSFRNTYLEAIMSRHGMGAMTSVSDTYVLEVICNAHTVTMRVVGRIASQSSTVSDETTNHRRRKPDISETIGGANDGGFEP